MKKLLKNTNQNYIIAIISVLVALSSQLYFSGFAGGFRISASVILLPLLIMTVGEDISTVKICFFTALSVLLLRTLIFMLQGGTAGQAFFLYIPNLCFYISYGVIFSILCQNKHTVTYKKIFGILYCCDFLSNIFEICITPSALNPENAVTTLSVLAGIALVRTAVTWLILVGEKQYRTLLQKEEHEKRYQRLFLMTTGLKNEIYFMKKNSEEIENVMGTAYKLYENLSSTDLPPEIKKMSLELAKDVHEIKKDYIRIIKGIENEISEEYDEKQMKFSDILHILYDTTHHLLESKNIDVVLNFNCNDDFITNDHYELMNILKNLVTNAIEAMETGEKGDTVTISQSLVGSEYIFEIKDNGPGISKRHLPNIFKMGYSTKFDTATGNIYRGVGLCGVKATIEETFGGTIEVSSVFGDGTDFIIKIPKNSVSVKE